MHGPYICVQPDEPVMPTDTERTEVVSGVYDISGHTKMGRAGQTSGGALLNVSQAVWNSRAV